MIIGNNLINVSQIVEAKCINLLGKKPYKIEASMTSGALRIWEFETAEERDNVFKELCRIVERVENPVIQVHHVSESSPVYGPVK